MGKRDGRVNRRPDMGSEALTTWGRNAHSLSTRSFAATATDIQGLMAARPARGLIARALAAAMATCVSTMAAMWWTSRGAP